MSTHQQTKFMRRHRRTATKGQVQVDSSALHEPEPSLLPNVWPEYIAFQSTLNNCVKHAECVQREDAELAIAAVSNNAISCFQKDRLAAFQLGMFEHAVKSGNTANVRDVIVIIRRFRARIAGTDLYTFAEEGFSAAFTNDLSLFSGLMVNRAPHSCCDDTSTKGDGLDCCQEVSAYSDLMDCAHECLAFLFEFIHPCASVALQPLKKTSHQRNTSYPECHKSPLFEVLGPAMSNLACRPGHSDSGNPLIDVFKWVPFLWLTRRYGNILMSIASSISDAPSVDLIHYVLTHVTSLADLNEKRATCLVTRKVLIQALLASGDLEWNSNFIIDAAANIESDCLPVFAKLKACLGVQSVPSLPSRKTSCVNSSNESMSSSSSSYSSSSPSTSSLRSSVNSNDSDMS